MHIVKIDAIDYSLADLLSSGFWLVESFNNKEITFVKKKIDKYPKWEKALPEEDGFFCDISLLLNYPLERTLEVLNRKYVMLDVRHVNHLVKYMLNKNENVQVHRTVNPTKNGVLFETNSKKALIMPVKLKERKSE